MIDERGSKFSLDQLIASASMSSFLMNSASGYVDPKFMGEEYPGVGQGGYPGMGVGGHGPAGDYYNQSAAAAASGLATNAILFCLLLCKISLICLKGNK